MRSQRVETYQQGSAWVAVTIDSQAGWLRIGATEVEALANLCNVLLEEMDGWPECEEWEP